MNAITKINSATESLAQQVQHIALLVEDEMTLRKRIDAAKKVIHEFNNARLEFESAKSARRTILGTIHLAAKADSGKAELKQADIALRDAELRALSKSDHADGASFALERLEPEAKQFHDRVAELRNQLPAMQLAAATEEAQIHIDNYIAAADSFENSFASVIGALQTLESMRPHNDKFPFTWHELFPCHVDLPSPPYIVERFGFVGFRSHDKVAALAQAQRQVFAEHLHSQGII
jgi:phage shock protein A